jgi:hypothetical protein
VPGDDGPPTGGGLGPAPSGDLEPLDNGIILVHAASAPAFRLCFASEPDLAPQPDSKVMPEANVVGVEVGSAVRIAPLKGAPGKVLLFDEALIRQYYPEGQGSAASCSRLATFDVPSIEVGSVADDLSTGVHILALTGCPKSTIYRTYTADECGAGYDPAKGNLTIRHIPLPGYERTGISDLPAQIVHLSQPLENARAGSDLVVSFGSVGTTPEGARTTVASGLTLFGGAAPAEGPIALAYDTTDIAAYDEVGFRVSLAPPDGGPPQTLAEQSLATVQRLSSPTDVPPSYYATASNYVLLLLGDPAPKGTDGGPTTDELRAVHFLAVPVIQPKADGGATPDGGADGG